MADQDDGKRPPEGELGTILSSHDSLFTSDLDGYGGQGAFTFEARDIAQMLRTESQAKKVETVLVAPILSAPKRITPAPGDKGEAEQVTEWLTRPATAGGMSTPLELVLAQATSAIAYRVASFERVWTTDPDDPRRVVYDKLALRPATNTRVLRDRKSGAYLGLEQDPPFGGMKPTRIKASRAWTYVHGQHRAPVLGGSDMEIPLVCWRSKQKLRFLWFLFLELHARPKVITQTSGDQGAGGSEDSTRKAAKMLANMPGGGAAPMPPGVTATVLETSGQAAGLFNGALQYLDGEMTGQVMAQFTDLAGAAVSGRGSNALSQDQSGFYLQSRRWAANELATSFTQWVIAPLVRHNLGAKAAVPTLEIGPLQPPALGDLTGLLSQAGPTALPGEFVAYLVEETATALGMKPDAAAAMMKAAKAAHEQTARSESREKLAGITGPLAAAEKIVRKAAQTDGGVRVAARAAADRATT